MRLLFAALLLVMAVKTTFAQNAAIEAQFTSWIKTELKQKAMANGINVRVFDRTMKDARINWSLPDLVIPGQKQNKKQSQQQAEFKSPANYFVEKRMKNLASIGRQLSQKHDRILRQIEQKYGVKRGFILAIWGRESGFGRAKIPYSVIDVLATKAFMSTRKELFETELIAALQIVQNGDVPAQNMRGSWAGAMGQPQFMPSSYLRYAVDFDGDGKRDIWNSEADTFASIANYLVQNHWVKDRDWGFEISMSNQLNCAREGPDRAKAISLWQNEGIARISGRAFPQNELKRAGMLILPQGVWGPKFLVTPNFYVIKQYNNSDNYALFVGNLADRIMYNSGGFKGGWTPQKTMYRSDVRTIQQRLEKQNYDVGGADGLPGYKTRRSIGAWQAQNNIKQTCFPHAELLRQMN